MKKDRAHKFHWAWIYLPVILLLGLLFFLKKIFVTSYTISTSCEFAYCAKHHHLTLLACRCNPILPGYFKIAQIEIF